MHWTEPATAADSHAELDKKLWTTADRLRSNLDAGASKY